MRRGRRTAVGLVLVALVTVALVAAPARPSGADGNEAPGAPEASRSITAGSDHTCAILLTGQVKCWGDNNLGKLGLGDTE